MIRAVLLASMLSAFALAALAADQPAAPPSATPPAPAPAAAPAPTPAGASSLTQTESSDDKPRDLRRNGAYAFPQAEAKVLCDNKDLRVSVWNTKEYLYVQAIVWSDGDSSLGRSEGYKIGDHSTLLLDVNCDQRATAGVDRDYHLNPCPWLPGLWYTISEGVKATTAFPGDFRGDSQGRGAVRYLVGLDGRRVRVDTFLIPLSEIRKKQGDPLRLAYYTWSPQPKMTLNSIGYENTRDYRFRDVPMQKYHEIALSELTAAFDSNQVPQGRQDKALPRGRQGFIVAAKSLQDAIARAKSSDILDSCGRRRADSELRAIGELKNLRLLSLSRTGIADADLEHFRGLVNLEELSLDNNPVSDHALEIAARLPKLRFLNLSKSKITDAGLEHVRGLGNLEELDLSWTAVGDKTLEIAASLPKLRGLSIDHTKITDEGLKHLAKSVSLEELALGGNAITDAGIRHLQRLSGLKRLYLDNTRITDACMEHVKGLAGLEEVTFEATAVGDNALEIAARLPKLRGLSVAHTKITDEGLKHLAKSVSLEELDLGGSAITDGGIRHLHGLSGLKAIQVDDAQITDAVLRVLKGFPGLEALYVEGPKVSRERIDKLKQSLPNCRVEMFFPDPVGPIPPPAVAPPRPQPRPQAWAAPVKPVRTWTDVTGKFRTEATLLGVQDGKARLQRKNGAIIAVPLEKLSEADREYAKHVASEPPRAIAPFDAAKAKEYQQSWARYLGVPIEITNSIGMKLVLIPPGEFDMGSSEKEIEHWFKSFRNVVREGPQHRFKIAAPFYAGKYEVTVAQFRKFVDATGYKTEAEKNGKGGLTVVPLQTKPENVWRDPRFAAQDDYPVTQVSWNDAVAFCKWLSEATGETYRLPTEHEWEYACRAGTTTRWSSGDDPQTLKLVANTADMSFKDKHHRKHAGGRWPITWDDGYPSVAPVGKFQPNPFGLHDMHGNVWEWCADWYEERAYWRYRLGDLSPPPIGSQRVLRGGCWFDDNPAHFGCACRHSWPPDSGTDAVGFRVVRGVGLPSGKPRGEGAGGKTAASDRAAAPSRNPEEIARRRQEYLDRYLKPLQAGKREDVPESRYAALFPPKVKTEFAMSKDGLTSKPFADCGCKRPLEPERLKDGKTLYFRGYFDAQERLRQVESYGPDGGLSDNPSQGCAAVRYWYNAQGLLIQEAFFDTASNLCENNRLEVVACHAYDAEGKRVEGRFFDGKGQPAEDRLGVHRRSYLAGKEPLEYRIDGTHRERWLPAVNLGKRINQGAVRHPCFTSDGKEMYFSAKDAQIHRSVWQGDHWSNPQPVLAGGKPLVGLRSAISSDDSLMAFGAWKKPYPDLPNYGGADLYVTERKDGQWQAVRNAGPKVNASNEEYGAAFVPGTNTLCLTANDPKTGQSQLWLADREGDQWGSPRPLGLQPAAHPGFSPDGNRLYFSAGRKGGFGHVDLWMARKQAGAWSRPINLGSPEVNGGGDDEGPCLTGNGMVLYYSRCCPWAIYVTGRADNEAAIRHIAEIYALGD